MFSVRNVNDRRVYYFSKKVSREKHIPFDISIDPFYSESNMRYLEQIARDVVEGKAHFAEHELLGVGE